MRRPHPLRLAFLSLLLATAANMAQSASASEFERFDANRDQQLSAAEFVAAKYSIADFKSADSDQNQSISAAEFASFKTSLSAAQKRQKSGPHPPRG